MSKLTKSQPQVIVNLPSSAFKAEAADIWKSIAFCVGCITLISLVSRN
ncbi:MAG TPA: hypothetical protein O0W97_05410 [Methanocorpusculum sp.]|nr:hypothetical protein [Methanocorpusculum sp.]